MAFFVILCLAGALAAAGRMKLGHDDDVPEFSNFSWFSMMFGAGIGIGMLTFATAEPMYHWAFEPGHDPGADEGSSRKTCVRPMSGPSPIGVWRPGHPTPSSGCRWPSSPIGATCR
jgi:choline-glycine betaine transporter